MKKGKMNQTALLFILAVMAIVTLLGVTIVQVNMENRSQAASCAGAGQTSYYGHACCSGLTPTNCKGSGSFVTCTCVAKTNCLSNHTNCYKSTWSPNCGLMILLEGTHKSTGVEAVVLESK